MNMHAFDAVSRCAAEGISRRRSLLTLGGAAVAATIARPSASDAKKKGNKCKKKEQQRCKNDAAACKTTVLALCDPPGTPECIVLQNCCDSCSASGFITCLAAATAV